MLRQGRVSNAQRRAHETLLPQYGVPYAPGILDLDPLYGRAAPRMLEIGFGMGETTADIAAAHPGIDYFALEVHTPGVGSLLKVIVERGIVNVRIVQHDAVEVLERMIAPGDLRRRAYFLPGSVAQEAASQAPIDTAALRLTAGFEAQVRRLRPRSDRLGRICAQILEVF